ncbi:hypothetical protein FHS43_003575 [Streptosporangium becharense]|uniref:Uncharacterized protein n=1 Tax=Streptosporangium becharense TaxID=1816182 RepID=A0A7W9IDR5_9ACTN|nr:hypothetical protein [Streptosporangium becharense]MBB2912295.1 hypothetical protein [Streptosporangium becharense]MBB5818842.1 hypothetical protein [Streptosporangium becharense]
MGSTENRGPAPGLMERRRDSWSGAGTPVGRQPAHTGYVPADRFGASTAGEWQEEQAPGDV